MSLAVTRWSGSPRPQGFVKCECVMPITLARSFISLAKASSDPATPSASVIAASLPDWMMRPRRRSSTRTDELTARNMVEPPDLVPPSRQACSDTVNLSSSLRRPSLISWNTTSAVITLVVEAGTMGASPLLLNSTVPVPASTR